MSELSKRITTALVLVVLVWAWYFNLPSPWFETVLALIGWGATCELILMVKLRASMVYMISSLLLWLAFLYAPQVEWLLFVTLFWFAAFVTVSRHQEASFSHFFAFIWLFGWLYLFALAIAKTHLSEVGQGLIIGACLAVWLSDIAAYFVGRAIGRHKLCPAISPGKSVEGLVGGVVLSVPLAVICWLMWDVVGLIPAIVLAIVTVFAGVLGDLSESAVKRLTGVKDSGRWLPGHGGILDRIDAIMMAVPVAWLLWGMIA